MWNRDNLYQRAIMTNTGDPDGDYDVIDSSAVNAVAVIWSQLERGMNTLLGTEQSKDVYPM